MGNDLFKWGWQGWKNRHMDCEVQGVERVQTGVHLPTGEPDHGTRKKQVNEMF